MERIIKNDRTKYWRKPNIKIFTLKETNSGTGIGTETFDSLASQ